MKTIIIILTSMITTIFYAQSADEIESFDRANKTVLSAIPDLVGKDYFIWEVKVGQMNVISKINNIYTYYNLELGRTEAAGDKIIDTRNVSYNSVLNKIFTNFVPKAGVKKFRSEYPSESLQLTYYFAIYKNGIKTFETCLPHAVKGVLIESPIDDDILDFLYDNVLVNINGSWNTYTNTFTSKNFNKNDCSSRLSGTTVSYTVPAGKYTSPVSQQAADDLAQAEILREGQKFANATGTCVYKNKERTGNFTKKDCPGTSKGSTLTYTVAAGTYTSTVSQQDANSKAQDDISINGQNYANANGSCLYKNAAQAERFTRNNCNPGGNAETVLYKVEAGTYTSTVSQEDANSKAQEDISINGQNYANANGSCLYKNAVQAERFIRNNCDPGGNGEAVLYKVEAGTYTSTVSQEEADNLAKAAMLANGQQFANDNGACVYKNTVQTESFLKKDCPTGGIPEPVTYKVPAKTYTSTTSQEDANAQALADIAANGQNYANANGACTFKNTAQSDSFRRNNCNQNKTGSVVLYTVEAGKYSSTLSQKDADDKAKADVASKGQTYANRQGTCN